MLKPKELEELVDQNLISQQQALEISQYYDKRKGSQPKRLSLILGAFGAIFVGLAIILILAHNWDTFSKNVRIVIAFLPLALSQIFAGYVLMRKDASSNLKEVSGIIWFFSLATTIFITSQIYHVSDPEGQFYALWVALSIPVVYLLNASILAMLSIVVITWYVLAYGFGDDTNLIFGYFYGIIAALLPYYILMIRRHAHRNAVYWLHWLFASAIILSFIPLGVNAGVVLLFAFMALFTLFYHLGHLSWFEGIPSAANAYLQTGRMGMVIALFVVGFSGFWKEVQESWHNGEILSSPLFVVLIVLSIIAIGLYIWRKQWQWQHLIDLDLILIPMFILLLTVHAYFFILANLLALAVGVMIMVRGIRGDSLLTINFGLFIIAMLILSRFFESDLSYLIRGLAFAIIGIAFFMTNYYLTKKSHRHE